jgi:FAD/FMN-containing dehydrogenase
MPALASQPARTSPASVAHPARPDLDQLHLRALRAAVGGVVLAPGDRGYHAARSAHNTVYDRRPAVIVRPSDATGVARAVLMARRMDLEIAVKAGGHSVAGHSTIEGGMLIDLGAMRSINIDPLRRVGTAAGGVTAGEYTLAAHEHGLATPLGDTVSVGLGGLTLGGGIGWLARKHGLTIDSLLGAEVVTADGRLVTVNEDDDPDLFWAIRGGGGNFGIVTKFRYRLHPVGTVTGGLLVLPLTSDVIAGFVEVAQAAPEALTAVANVMPLPPAPFVPADSVGVPAVMVTMVHAGDPEQAPEAIAPFRALGAPLLDRVGPMPYPAIYEYTRGGSRPGPSVLRSSFLPSLADHAVDAILERHEAPGGRPAITQLRVLGGAMARVPADATAFAHRQAPIMAAVIAGVVDSHAATTAWAAAYLSELAVNGCGAYSNFLGDEGEARIRAAWPGTTYERLVAVKRRVDPDNVFHANQNIRPD